MKRAAAEPPRFKPPKQRLNAELNRIMTLPEMEDRLAGMGVEVAPKGTDAFAQRLRADAGNRDALIRRLGIEAS